MSSPLIVIIVKNYSLNIKFIYSKQQIDNLIPDLDYLDIEKGVDSIQPICTKPKTKSHPSTPIDLEALPFSWLFT